MLRLAVYPIYVAQHRITKNFRYKIPKFPEISRKKGNSTHPVEKQTMLRKHIYDPITKLKGPQYFTVWEALITHFSDFFVVAAGRILFSEGGEGARNFYKRKSRYHYWKNTACFKNSWPFLRISFKSMQKIFILKMAVFSIEDAVKSQVTSYLRENLKPCVAPSIPRVGQFYNIVNILHYQYWKTFNINIYDSVHSLSSVLFEHRNRTSRRGYTGKTMRDNCISQRKLLEL